MRNVLVLVTVVLAACSTEVAAGLDEVQSQEALAVLAEAGIAAGRVPAGEGRDRSYRIEVSSRDAGKAAQVLLSQGLPRREKKGFAQLYQSSSMIPTATEEKARFLDALSDEIESHLEKVDGVAEASVMVTAPSEDPLAPPDANKARPTASVLLKVRADRELPGEDSIQRLVAGAVEGLQPTDVAVVTIPVAPAKVETALFDRVGPIRVARSSKPVLIAVLGGACAVIMLMGLWLLLGARRTAQLRSRMADMGRGHTA